MHFIGGEVYDLPFDEAMYWVREGAADKIVEDKQKDETQKELIVQEIEKPVTRPVTRKTKKKPATRKK